MTRRPMHEHAAPALDAAVIICAYTDLRWQELLEAAASVRRQSTPARQIIVVVDNNPALFERAQAHLPFATVVENNQAPGLSGARNTGIALAETAVVAFMDEDAIADPDWLATLLEGYKDDQVAGVGGAVLPLWDGGRPGWFPAEYDWVVGCTYAGANDKPGPVRNFIGCNMSFRRSALEAVAQGAGPFTANLGRTGDRHAGRRLTFRRASQVDQRPAAPLEAAKAQSGLGAACLAAAPKQAAPLPISCDETELCIRLSRRLPESRLLHEPRARVLHRVPRQRATWSYFRTRCYAEGLSKAFVTRMVGAGAGLSSERSYVLRTLPAAVGRGLLSLLMQLDKDVAGRTGAVLAGLAITAFGYAAGRIQFLPASIPAEPTAAVSAAAEPAPALEPWPGANPAGVQQGIGGGQ